MSVECSLALLTRTSAASYYPGRHADRSPALRNVYHNYSVRTYLSPCTDVYSSKNNCPRADVDTITQSRRLNPTPPVNSERHAVVDRGIGSNFGIWMDNGSSRAVWESKAGSCLD